MPRPVQFSVAADTVDLALLLVRDASSTGGRSVVAQLPGESAI
jgi:hypothetical protein